MLGPDWPSLFQREFTRWTGAAPDYVESYDRFVVNAQARSDMEAVSPRVLILDESHMLTNRMSKRATMVLKGPAKVAPYCWALTGTPLRNGPHDGFTILADVRAGAAGGERHH